MVNKAAAMAPELDPATARIVKVDEESLNTRATPRWYGNSIPAPLKDTVQNRLVAIVVEADILVVTAILFSVRTCPTAAIKSGIHGGFLLVNGMWGELCDGMMGWLTET